MDEGDPEVTELLADLTRELREIRREVEPEPRRPRPPTRQELARFTSEVTIPALILMLQTQIRALELLRRTIRLANEPTRGQSSTQTAVRERAESLGISTLTRLETVLSELQQAVEERPDDDVDELLSEARRLREQIETELTKADSVSTGMGEDGAAYDTESADTTTAEAGSGQTAGSAAERAGESAQIPIDVEEELRALKQRAEDEGKDDQSGPDE